MTNVVTVEFRKPGAAAHNAKVKSKRGKAPAIAPDDYAFVTTLQRAVDIAGLVYRDMEAVDILMAEMRKMYARGDGQGYLPIEVRARCAKYLAPGDQNTLDTSKATQIMLGDPAR